MWENAGPPVTETPQLNWVGGGGHGRGFYTHANGTCVVVADER